MLEKFLRSLGFETSDNAYYSKGEIIVGVSDNVVITDSNELVYHGDIEGAVETLSIIFDL